MSSSHVPETTRRPRRARTSSSAQDAPTTTAPVPAPGGARHDPTSDPRTAARLSGRASNGALASVLAPRTEAAEPAPPPAPARTALTADQILAGLESSTYLAGQLGTSSRGQMRAAAKNGATPAETVRERIQAEITRFEAMFASGADGSTQAAMKLTLAMDGVAKVMAEALYDTTLEPMLAEQLFRVYGPKIAKNLKQQGGDGAEVDEAVQLAHAMVSGDPVARFMHHQMRLDQAAFEVKALAGKANKTPQEMFDLLSQRFQAEMGSYSFTQVQEHQHTRGSYEIREVDGELSTDYFEELFGSSVADVDNRGKLAPTRGDPSQGLAFSTEARTRLASLGAAVATAADRSPLPDTAAGRRRQHLADVTAADASVKAGRRTRVEQELIALGADRAKVAAIIAQLEAGLPNLPLTITVSGVRWFGNDEKGRPKTVNPEFRSAGGTTRHKQAAGDIGKRGTKARKALKGETVEYGGRYEDPMYAQERGDTYLEFRRWKDQRMTGNLGMRPEELPVFGAVNTNWAATRGTGGYMASGRVRALEQKAKKQKLSKAEKAELAEHQRMQDLQDKDRIAGVNYYGDTHFVLDPASVRNRMVYTAGDHGRPHTDPFLAFADFLLPNDAQEVYNGEVYRSDVTRMRPEGVKKPVVYDVINMLLLGAGQAPKVVRDLPFEIQIFGGIDLRTDVLEIHVAPAAPDEVLTNADNWAKANAPGVLVRRITDAEGITVKVGSAAAADIAKQALKDYV